MDNEKDRRKWPRQAGLEKGLVELVGITTARDSLHFADRKGSARAGWADMRDLSQKGMGLRLLRKGDLKPLNKNDSLLMIYRLPGVDYYLRAVGNIRWQKKKKDGTVDFGVQFQALTVKDRFHLERYLQSQSYRE